MKEPFELRDKLKAVAGAGTPAMRSEEESQAVAHISAKRAVKGKISATGVNPKVQAKFYLPLHLKRALAKAAAGQGKSESELVTEALSSHPEVKAEL